MAESQIAMPVGLLSFCLANHWGRPPVPACSSLEEDVALLKSLVAAAATEAGAGSGAVPDDLTAEIVRSGGGELHAVAAVVGGIAAQEAIKLLTGQFVPLAGSLLYSALASANSACLVLPA